MYSCNNSTVSFESNGPQIVELPDDYAASDSNDSCPELVPIVDDDAPVVTTVVAAVAPNFTDSFVLKVDTKHQFEPCPIDFPADDQEIENADEFLLNISATHHPNILSTVHDRLNDVNVMSELDNEQPQEQKCDKKVKLAVPIPQTTKPIANYDDDDVDEGGTVDAVICPRFYNALNSRQVLLVLKSPLYFHGILNVRLLVGAATVYGYELTKDVATVYSPRGHSFVDISPSFNSSVSDAAALIESAAKALQSIESEFLNADIYDALRIYQPSTDAILLLERGACDSGAVHMINNYMKQTVFPNAQAFNVRRTYFGSEFILNCQFFLKPRVSLQSSAQWLSATLRSATSRTIVCGGKGVGKSTFVRYMLNDGLGRFERILLIDLDIGQPELGLPQTVSATCVRSPILGPGYMRSAQPDLAYLVGDINVALSPIRYLRIVLRLLHECQQAHNDWTDNCPWIINTMGYTKGFGLELTAAIIKALQPTNVVQIQAARSAQNFDVILDANEINEYRFNIFENEVVDIVGSTTCSYQMHLFDSVARKFGERTNEWDMSAKDLRFAIILSHLGNALCERAEWITDVVPFW